MASRVECPGMAQAVNDTGTTDHDLLARYRIGDQDAAARIYQRYAGRLRALARSRFSATLARRLDVDDIVQSAFRRFFDAVSQGRYEVPSDEDLWNLLLVITLNRLRTEEMYHRAAKRDIRQSCELDAISPTDQNSHVNRDSTYLLLRMTVREALARLPESMREIVEMRMLSHDVQTIADTTGRSKRTVERILHESRSRLRGLMGETP